MIQLKKNKGHVIVSGVSLILFIGSVIFLQFQINVNDRLEAELNKSKLNDEIALSEKLALEKEIVKLKSSLVSNGRSYEESNQTLIATFEELEKIKKKLMANKKNAELMDELKKENAELLDEIKKLEQKVVECEALMARFESYLK